jgi:hypothetical protein
VSGCSCVPRGLLRERLIGTEAVDDAPLLKVIGGHLDLHAITGENPHAVDPHTPRERAEEFVVLHLF